MSLQLKADFVPVTVLSISESSAKKLSDQLDASIEKAPQYFKNAPLIIDFTEVKRPKAGINMKSICKVLRDKSIIPIGVRGIIDDEIPSVYAQGLAVMKKESVKPAVSASPKSAPAPSAPTRSVTKVITQPVRAGTQVYAKGGDLVVLSSVNAGAECLADGNIHVYGPLRGRALAGVKGDVKARIFCRSLEAELVAIAGYYWVSDEIPKTALVEQGALLHIHLDGDKLHLAQI